MVDTIGDCACCGEDETLDFKCVTALVWWPGYWQLTKSNGEANFQNIESAAVGIYFPTKYRTTEYVSRYSDGSTVYNLRRVFTWDNLYGDLASATASSELSFNGVAVTEHTYNISWTPADGSYFASQVYFRTGETPSERVGPWGVGYVNGTPEQAPFIVVSQAFSTPFWLFPPANTKATFISDTFVEAEFVSGGRNFYGSITLSNPSNYNTLVSGGLVDLLNTLPLETTPVVVNAVPNQDINWLNPVSNSYTLARGTEAQVIINTGGRATNFITRCRNRARGGVLSVAGKATDFHQVQLIETSGPLYDFALYGTRSDLFPLQFSAGLTGEDGPFFSLPIVLRKSVVNFNIGLKCSNALWRIEVVRPYNQVVNTNGTPVKVTGDLPPGEYITVPFALVEGGTVLGGLSLAQKLGGSYGGGWIGSDGSFPFPWNPTWCP